MKFKLAIQTGSIKIITLLLMKPDILFENHDIRNAIFILADNRSIHILQHFLINRRISINLLMVGVRREYECVVDLAYYISPHLIPNILKYAIISGKINIVEHLFAKIGYSDNIKDEFISLPLLCNEDVIWRIITICESMGKPPTDDALNKLGYYALFAGMDDLVLTMLNTNRLKYEYLLTKVHRSENKDMIEKLSLYDNFPNNNI